MQISVILVHYHAADLTRQAQAALDADAAASGLNVEWVFVDNGSSEAERELLRTLPGRLLEPGRNLGFAGGVNLGVQASTSDIFLLMNPDVMVRPGCLGALSEALRSGAAAAGPRFRWDPAGNFLLPPTEERGRWPELRSVLAGRGGRWERRALRAWRRHAYPYWQADEALVSYELSGALLALTRQAWDQIGPFDDAYPLYFEETDWLLRLRDQRLVALFVPGAEATHLYAQSSRKESRAGEWFQASSRRFRRKRYGEAFSRFLEGLAVRGAKAGAGGIAIENLRLPRQAREAHWLEWSASPSGFPAAGSSLESREDGGERAISSAAESAPPGTYYLRWVDRRGHDLATLPLRI